MSTQPRLQPTRRTVLRSAAWSTAAVTVVVATPNIAAASSPLSPKATVTPKTPEKHGDGSTKYVSWDIDVYADNMDLKGLTLLLAYDQSGGGKDARLEAVEVSNFSPTGSWSANITKATMVATATATTAVVVTKGTTAHIHVRFRGTDNSSGKVSATLMANDSAGTSMTIGTIAATSWVSGSAHIHPAA